MMWQQRGKDGAPTEVRPDARKELYSDILRQAHEVAEKTVNRLQDLHERFPDDFPAGVLDALRHARSDGPQAPGGPPHDRRRAPRFPKPHGRAVLADPFVPGNTWHGDVLDWSWDGLRLHSDRPLRPGTVLTMRPAHGSAEPSAVIEVRHCTASAGGWQAGCQILRTL